MIKAVKHKAQHLFDDNHTIASTKWLWFYIHCMRYILVTDINYFFNQTFSYK